MTTRRRAREVVLRILYQADVNRETIESVTGEVVAALDASDDVRAYVLEITAAVEDRSEEIDGLLSEASKNWSVRRMASIDRNVMRAAVAELIVHRDVDARVILDEAVSIAEAFGTDDSSAFVNGVLDDIARRVRPGEL